MLAICATLSTAATLSRVRVPRRAVCHTAASACACQFSKRAAAGIWTGPNELTSPASVLQPGPPRFDGETMLYTETFVATFTESALGLDLKAAGGGGRIVVKSVKPGLPGFLAGIPPGYLALSSVNGQSTAGLSLP